MEEPQSAALVAAHNLYQANQLLEAHRACESILRADGTSVAGWLLLGQIKSRLGQEADAISCARRACRFNPDDARCQLQLATALATHGDTAEAISLADDLEFKPAEDDAATLANLSAVYSLCGRHEQALKLLHRAASLQPQGPTYVYNMALAYRALGEFTEAEDCCNRAIALGISDRQVYYIRSGLRRQTLQHNHLDDLKTQLTTGKQNAMDSVFLNYAMGKEFEDIGNFDDAFTSYDRAAGTYRKLVRYDVSGDVDAIDQLVALHGTTALERVPPGWTGARPVFIVGMPRSGTTLVERIVQSHPAIAAVGERRDFAQLLQQMGREQTKQASTSRDTLIKASLSLDMRRLGQAYTDQVSGNAACGLRTLDKMPLNYLYCGLISRALPDARIIAVRRNPVDSCFAAYKAFLTGPYAFTYDLDELSAYYAAFDRLLQHWATTLSPSQYQEVAYEDVVLNTEKTARSLMTFLDLDFDPAQLAFHRSTGASTTVSAEQVRRPIYTTSVGNWRNYRTQLEPLIAGLRNAGVALDAG